MNGSRPITLRSRLRDFSHGEHGVKRGGQGQKMKNSKVKGELRTDLQTWLDSQEPLLRYTDTPDLAMLQRGLAAQGLEVHVIDFQTATDKSSLLRIIHQAMNWPAWFGFNWDALEDALYGPEATDAAPQVLICHGLRSLEQQAPDDAAVFYDILASVATDERSTLRGAIVVT